MSRANREFKEGQMREEFKTAETRAFGGPEATESDDLEPGNLNENDLKECAVDEITPGNIKSIDELKEYKDNETDFLFNQKSPLESEPEIKPIVSSEQEKSPIENKEPIASFSEQPSSESENSQKIETEIKETINETVQETELLKEEIITPQESPNVQENTQNIIEPIETSEKESETSALKRKNILIKENKQIIIDYMKVRERAIQLQEQIKKDSKAFTRFKKFFTGAPKSNLMEEYKGAYDSLKAKEKEIEEKTTATPNELLILWEQYKQAKESKSRKKQL
jgi:hypothetical protein